MKWLNELDSDNCSDVILTSLPCSDDEEPCMTTQGLLTTHGPPTTHGSPTTAAHTTAAQTTVIDTTTKAETTIDQTTLPQTTVAQTTKAETTKATTTTALSTETKATADQTTVAPTKVTTTSDLTTMETDEDLIADTLMGSWIDKHHPTHIPASGEFSVCAITGQESAPWIAFTLSKLSIISGLHLKGKL